MVRVQHVYRWTPVMAEAAGKTLRLERPPRRGPVAHQKHGSHPPAKVRAINDTCCQAVRSPFTGTSCSELGVHDYE